MLRPRYTVHDVCWKMISTSGEHPEANVYTNTRVHRLIRLTVMHSADEELGVIDNLSLNQLEAEGEATELIGPTEHEKIDTYEQKEDTLKIMSKDTTASADADVTSSAASLIVTSFAGL